ncbi:hypothetical protein QQG55_11545 [Brugia pahangi]
MYGPALLTITTTAGKARKRQATETNLPHEPYLSHPSLNRSILQAHHPLRHMSLPASFPQPPHNHTIVSLPSFGIGTDLLPPSSHSVLLVLLLTLHISVIVPNPTLTLPNILSNPPLHSILP